MKTQTCKSFLMFMLMIMSVILFQCQNDEEVTLSEISGKVTYADAIPADGAIVIIYSDEEGTNTINRVVADPNGNYSLSGLSNGTYYLVAKYNTENVNNLKAGGYNFTTSSPVSVEVNSSVTKDIQLVNSPGGDETVNTYDESWRFDKAHSNVNWSTAYMGDNAYLTGKFNSFHIDLDFDEANPENAKIYAWVQLSSANTGEPGRDDPGKCLNGYLGVVTDTLSDGSYYVSEPNTDTAYFESKDVTVYGDGYKAVGDFVFRGVTKSVNLYFNYIGQADYSSAGDGSNIRGGFTGEFEFMAISDFGVTSSSISDKVLVYINANYRKN